MNKVKLGDVADVKLSNVDKKTKPNEMEVRLCNYTDVYKNWSIKNDMAGGFMIATCNENELEKFLLKKGQVAITKDSETPDDIGVSAYIAEDFENVVLGYHLALITPFNDKLNGRFLNYYFHTKHLQSYFENNAGGSGQRCSLSIDTIKEIPLFLPDIETQSAIAGVLSSLDDKIALNNKINKELEDLAKTIYDYWFVQNADEKWEKKRIGELIKKYTDNSLKIDAKNILKEGKHPVITQDVGDLIKGYTNEDNPISDLPAIVFGDHSCTLRYINFPFFRGADGTQVLYFENEETTLYVYFCIGKLIPNLPNFGKYERHFKYLKDFEIIIPSIHFLEKFNKTVSPIFNQILKNRQESTHLARLRDWLLPMLMERVIAEDFSVVQQEGSREMLEIETKNKQI